MDYNTQRDELPMPEYGRAVQDMVNHAITIKDPKVRENCAYTIIGIMGGMFPTLRDIPDFQDKLWDHLAFMSDYKLEINYPCNITRLTKEKVKPDHIDYTKVDVHYRHYGQIIPDIIKLASAMPAGPERDQLVRLIAIQMKKDLMIWNKESVIDEHIAADLQTLSKGVLTLKTEELDVEFAKAPPAPQKQQRGKRKNKKRR